MIPKGNYFFVNARTQSEYGPIPGEYVETFLKNLSNELKDLFVYTDKLGRWMPIDKAGLFSKSESRKIEGHPDHRSNPRFPVNLSVTFVCGDRAFKTETVDISEGGLSLRNALPISFVGKNLTIYLSNLDFSFKLMFEVVALNNGNRCQRIRFVKQSEFSKKQFNLLLDEVSRMPTDQDHQPQKLSKAS